MRDFQHSDNPTGLRCQLPETADLMLYSDQVRELYPRVMRLARHLVGNTADAEDVVQEALLKAFQHFQDYRHEASFSTWLFRITWNESINSHRKRSLERIGLADLSPMYGNRRPHLWATLRDTPEQICRAGEIQELLKDSLRRMKPCYQEVWLLRQIDDLSNADIAKQLGLRLSTVKIRMHRARRQLRILVGDRLSRPTRARHHVGTARSPIAPGENVIRLDYSPTVDEFPVRAA